MAAGKNLASDILAKNGWACIDADKLAHQALSLLQNEVIRLHKKAAENLGLTLQNEDGSLNRKNIAKIVFTDSEALKKHEALIHPMIEKLLYDFIMEHKTEAVVLNATVLYKVSIIMECDAIFFIDAPLIIRLFRAKKRDNTSIVEILARFRSQSNIFAKYKNSNADIYRVWNLSSPYALEQKLKRILKLWNRKKHYGLLPQ